MWRHFCDEMNVSNSFILKKGEAPVFVACNAVITGKHIFIDCADSVKIRKKYFEKRSLYSLFFFNVISEIFGILRLVCSTKYVVC